MPYRSSRKNYLKIFSWLLKYDMTIISESYDVEVIVRKLY